MLMTSDSESVAKFWGVTVRTVQRWRAAGMRPDSVVFMRNWARAQKRPAKAVVDKLTQLDDDAAREELADVDLDSLEIDDDPAGDIAALQRYKVYYDRKLAKAIATRRRDDVRFYTDQLVKVSESVRKARIMADRLGLQFGEMLPREKVENWIRNFVWWMFRCVDAAKASMRPRLVSLDFEEEVEAVLEPALIDAAIYQPLVMSVGERSQVDLPPWFGEAVQRAVDEFFEEDCENVETEKHG